MPKRTGSSLLSTENLIRELRILSNKENVKIWKRIAKDLEKSTRQRREVNVYKINKHIREDETAIVPGKVLSEGELKKPITVAAFRFSEKAKNKINKIGKAISIKKLIKDNPKGKKMRIIG